MNRYQYSLIKQAATNWMSNADTPENTLGDDSDLYKNVEKTYEENKDTYDPIKDGPMYQDVSPIYQEPSKYGIPEEVAMAEREHHDNEMNRWRQEYQDQMNDMYRTEVGPLGDAVSISPTMVNAMSGMGGYDVPAMPTINALINDTYSKPDATEPFAGASTYLSPDKMTSDKFLNGYQRMQGAPMAIRSNYEGLMNTRNNLKMRISLESDPLVLERLNKSLKRIENNMQFLINQLDK